MAGGAGEADGTAPLRPAADELGVDVAVVALQRRVAHRVAVHAARALQHGAHGLERCCGIAFRRRPGSGRRRAGRVRTRGGGCSGDAGEPGFHGRLLRQARRSGSERKRFFVSAKTALATAAAMGATPGSPMPPIFASLSRTCTETCGMSGRRSTR